MTAPNESFEDLVRRAGLAIADLLEHEETPATLKDSLRETACGLIDILGGENAAQHLRALALASGHTLTSPEAEKTLTSRFCAKNGDQNGDFRALAEVSTVH